MRAPEEIVRVWRRFAGFPMETLTKAWRYHLCQGSAGQRSVALMREHRANFGCGGNCFDLALWLLAEFETASVQAHAIGHDLFTPDAHIAVIAFDRQGYGYLCDLGDQWLQPILVDPRAPDFTDTFCSGFFPAAQVSVQVANKDEIAVRYRRPNGKESLQQFDMTPLTAERLWQAADYSQKLLRHPLVEIRAIHPPSGQMGHWEYSHGRSRWSLDSGLLFDDDCPTLAGWIQRIHDMTGIAPEVIAAAFAVYERWGTESSYLV